MLSIHRAANDRISQWMLIYTCFIVLGVCYLFQSGFIDGELLPPYLFVFVAGHIGLCAYLFFTRTPRHQYYIPIHLFLWMLLFLTSHTALYYSAGILFIFAAIFYLTTFSLQPLIKWFSCFFMLGCFVLANLFDKELLFLACTFYMMVAVLHSPNQRKEHKWNIVIVGLMHVLGIAASSSSILVFPYQENTIFTLPTSFLIYVLILTMGKIIRSTYLFLFPPAILFIYFAIVLLGYSAASFQLVVVGNNVFHYYWTVGLLLGCIALTICWHIRKVIAARYELVRNQLDDWFRQKFEDVLSHDKQMKWSGFDSTLAKFAPNDGIRIMYQNDEIFANGCFREPNAPAGKLIHSGRDVSIFIHETNAHTPYTPSHYYTFCAMAIYMDEKLAQWQEISSLKAGRSEGGGDFGQDLKFRQEVTYYLHDNILQNIIAAKNMVESIATEQAALKELAVDTLSKLNSSIRSQMHDIYPSTLADLSFERNIHILIDDMRKRYSYIPTPHITYDIQDKLDEQSAYLFYRTIQELFSNTCKYAQADHFWVHMYTDESWILEVREDGEPIKPEDLETKIKHLGISSLKQQAHALNGVFEMMQNEQEKRFKLTLPRRVHHEDTTN